MSGLNSNPEVRKYEERYFNDISEKVNAVSPEHMVQFINEMIPTYLPPGLVSEKIKGIQLPKEALKVKHVIALLANKLVKR